MSVESLTETKLISDELRERQDQFAALLGIDPEQLRHLEFCEECGGADYQWVDYGISEVDVDDLWIETSEEALEYRSYLAHSACKSCNGSGFKGGETLNSPDRIDYLTALSL